VRLNGIATNLFAYVNYELSISVSYNKLQHKNMMCVLHKVQIEMPVEMGKYADVIITNFFFLHRYFQSTNYLKHVGDDVAVLEVVPWKCWTCRTYDFTKQGHA
jgi:hypothetical protein